MSIGGDGFQIKDDQGRLWFRCGSGGSLPSLLPLPTPRPEQRALCCAICIPSRAPDGLRCNRGPRRRQRWEPASCQALPVDGRARCSTSCLLYTSRRG